ncbi:MULTISPECIES: hypothetical protein [unclassified Streptomyces]|uniref:hypothetical protein n=1 Tax=unclassified Streptomyces TaxID=2593676 RepID=UPI003811EBFB
MGATAHATPAPESEGTVQIMAGICSTGNFCMFDLADFNAGSTTSTNLWRDIVYDDNTFAGNHRRDGNGSLTALIMDNAPAR